MVAYFPLLPSVSGYNWQRGLSLSGSDKLPDSGSHLSRRPLGTTLGPLRAHLVCFLNVRGSLSDSPGLDLGAS